MILWLFTEVFSAKFGGWCPLAWQNRAIRESFLCGNGIFHQFTKIFSLKRFLLYGSITSHHSLKVLVYVGHMPYQSWALFSSMFFFAFSNVYHWRLPGFCNLCGTGTWSRNETFWRYGRDIYSRSGVCLTLKTMCNSILSPAFPGYLVAMIPSRASSS